MADGGPTQDAVRVEDGQLQVDARPALLVAQLQSSGGEPYVTIHSEAGSLHRAVPGNVRTGTYRLSDEVTVEAVRASTFVAVEEGGRLLVAAFGGEVVLRSGTEGDRLALAPHEGVLVPVAGGEPRVVALSDAGADADLTSMVDRVTEAMAAPEEAVASATPLPVEPEVEPEPEPGPETASDSAAGAATAVPAAAPKPAAPTTAGGARSPGNKGKKGKKARQRQAQQQRAAGGAAAKKPAAPAPAPMGSQKAAQADKADKAAPVKKTAAPTKAAGAPKKKAAVTTAGAGARPRPDGGSHVGRRVAAVVLALAAVIAAVLVLTRDNDDGTTVASEDTTTTEAETSSTSETSAPPETSTSTTEPPATTTTEAPPATTTTAAAPVANYRFVPRSCVQSGNTITYTASITNQAQATFDYLVRVRFVDTGGTEVATANASVNDVRPGQTREVRATGTSNRDLRNSGANCEVVAVEPAAS